MISIGENKAVLCKGDFHPAALYKGNKKIAGYTVAEFSGEGGATLENCYNDKLHNAQVFGNTVQDGTPTPENPIEVQSVGELVTEGEYAGKYKIPVTARGKNLFKYIKGGLKNGIYIQQLPNGAIVQGNMSSAGTNAHAHSQGWFTPGEVSSHAILPTLHTGDVVTVSADITLLELIQGNEYKPRIYIRAREDGTSFLDAGTVAIGVNETKRVSKKYTITNALDGKHIHPVFTLNSNTVKIENIQIEYGNATPYEPYIEPQTFNLYLDEPLRKVGDYADYVDFDKDVVARKVRKKVCDGTETWGRDSACFSLVIPTYFLSVDLVHCLCNYLRGETWENIWGNHDRINGEKVVGVAKKSDRITVTPYPTLPTTEEWKAQLAAWYEEGNPFTVWYVIPTIEEPIDLPKLPTFKGTTIYEIDTDVTATVSGKYKRTEE